MEFKELIDKLNLEWEWTQFIDKSEEWDKTNLILGAEEHFLLYNYINDSEMLNSSLLRESIDPTIIEYERWLNIILSKLPNYFPKPPTFRGCHFPNERFELYQQETEIRESTFFSTTKRDYIALEFSSNTFITIRGRTGKEVSLYADKSRKREEEVLFRTNTIFQVIDIFIEGKITYITLEEVNSLINIHHADN